MDTDWLPGWLERRTCPGMAGHVCLPELDLILTGAGTSRLITVSWAEGRFDDAESGSSSFDYVLELPQEWLP